ncbi:MAG: hypothetical protein GKR94_22135 [Gammaproteobacteria bacterium]|nr:hypothetical protein [Gammaproteobacteria bacterium]
MIIFTVGSDLVVQLEPLENENEISDQVAVENWTTPELRVENLRFTNDFAIDLGAIDHAQAGDENSNVIAALDDQASWLGGGAGDDRLDGSSKADILFGGEGKDQLSGGAGDDVYMFNRGDGQDVLEDTGSGSVGTDTDNPGGDKLLFGEGITIEDLITQRDGSDLVIYTNRH